MIKIRTISYNTPRALTNQDYSLMEKCAKEWRNFSFEARTQRLTLPLMHCDLQHYHFDETAAFCDHTGIRWFNIPIDPWYEDALMNSDVIHDVLQKHKGAFCNIICAKNGMIREDILQYVSETILNVSRITATGNANFRFGASMNVLPDGPFFPFTYSQGDALSFSIGLELAEEINKLMSKNACDDLNELRKQLTDTLEPQISEIERFAKTLAKRYGLIYKGIDFSLAPLPEEGNSVITILNALGISNIDNIGIMFGTAFLTDFLKTMANKHIHVGFSGVMYSLLEDRNLAKINDRNEFSIDRMISLSTMCGCGVDMVPIHSNTEKDAIRTILMEIACVSSRLSKPLGVRILPIDSTDEWTHIDEDQDFIVNTRIVNVNANRMPHFLNDYMISMHKQEKGTAIL